MTRIRHPNHKLTATGYYVCAVKRGELSWRDNKTNELKTIKYISGRITKSPHNENLHPAQWAKWRLDGQAVKHEFGDLILGNGV